MYPFLLNTFSNSGEQQKPVLKVEEGIFETSRVFMLSGRDTSESVIKNGDFANLGINEVLCRIAPEFKDTAFPIFIELIKTAERTPVKVYPNDEYALSHEGTTGKKSLIYICDCLEDSEMVYGLRRTLSSDELRNRTLSGSLSEVCNYVAVQKGDVFYVPSGVVFSLSAGICALVISVNSDAEYIISDYSSNRSPQINRAVEVMSPKRINIRYGNTGEMTLFPFGTVRELGFTDSFKSELLSVDGNFGLYEDDCFVSLIVTSGQADMSYPSGTMHISAGHSILIPYGIKVRLSGRAEMVYTRIYTQKKES